MYYALPPLVRFFEVTRLLLGGLGSEIADFLSGRFIARITEENLSLTFANSFSLH